MPPNPELKILNAESYNDGKSAFRAPRSLPSGRPRRAAIGDEPPKSKKRTKAQSSEAGELEDEDKKRSRGRPRLDTNDETAKERRRTQIRLAQRAYRNRKETAIQSLEKKVDELRKINEEMSKEFMRIYDFAVSKGMHESTPEFGCQLQATTEKFVALARRSSEELEKDGDLPTSQDNDVDAQEASPTTGNAGLSDTSGSQDVAVKPAEMMYGGFIVSHGEDTAPSTPRFQKLTAMHTTSWAPDSQSQAPHSTPPQAPLGYEIVTEPTTDNASFPFGMSFDDSLDQAGSLNLSGQPFSETLFSILSPPSSYAYQERTFGRRLQRSTLEKAYFLVCMPDPPPAVMSKAFGFCLLFETKDRIKERLANRLRVNERESMFNWKFPFWNLGGGGTWFDATDDETDYSRDGKLRGPVGNQGTAEPHRHNVDSMFGLGPWDARTEETRDLRVNHGAAKLHMSVPGFEGDFYDADEVEWVLRQRGIFIPPAADFVTAEIDPADFSTDTTAGGQVFGTGSQSSVDDILSGLRRAEKSPLAHFARGYVGMNLQPTRASDIDNGSHSVARTEEALPAPKDIDPSLGGDAFGLGEKPANGPSDTGLRKRLVTINVGVLVQEIALRSVCLGRTPGVRPKDVNVAFWASLAV
ncbi:BZIP family transcription factor [Colletotrichum graminicola M1.001]|uniref:BZIP family transcription factor n=1 Tax=Colletotrichum graminicola (strain M1.001 / M2 / FGSC 10212) TaxID=645133 RepID=E3QKL6_COLGM|nr:BZIP family transcription factor [Colletotrichum graminicola M1.001]EFQ31404.1 BZIP family transcription factor [Colletotrichum graminicola M1.001]